LGSVAPQNRKDVSIIEEMRIYIMDTSKPYNEDEDGYSGAWFSCPVDIEEVKERLGLESEDE